MTSAKGRPQRDSRRPSAAFLCRAIRRARGATPPWPGAAPVAQAMGLSAILLATPAGAQDGTRPPGAPPERLAEAGRTMAAPRADCLAAARRAERIHALPEGLMVAIALSESGLHAHALNLGGRAHFPESAAAARALLGRAPPGANVMAGCVQVNARVHARGSDWPLDPLRATDWAGGLLRRWHAETGDWTRALARWHGGSPAGTRRVICRVRARLDLVAPGSAALADAGCAGPMAERERRSAADLLSIAQAELR